MDKLIETYLKEYTFREVPEGVEPIASMDAETLKKVILDCFGYVNQKMEEEILKAAIGPSKKLH